MNLKNHPFAVDAFFDASLVLTYAVPKGELEKLIPPCLELDTFDDEWGFVAVAMVKTRDLRPKGFPRFIGNDFFLAGYRLFVRYTTSQGKRWRGLYILKSETDRAKMTLLGNVFTHYKYTTTDIDCKLNETSMSVHSKQSALDVVVDWKEESIALPKGSPFQDWKEARRYAGPLPFTFTFNAVTKEVLIIEGVRQNWTPKPVRVIQSDVGFITEKKFNTCRLANAFVVQSIPYSWKKGKLEVWKQ